MENNIGEIKCIDYLDLLIHTKNPDLDWEGLVKELPKIPFYMPEYKNFTFQDGRELNYIPIDLQISDGSENEK
jgi:hypothetical protein